MENVRDYTTATSPRSVNEIEVSICWGFVHVLVGVCLQCRAVFINRKRVRGLYCEIKERCDHKY